MKMFVDNEFREMIDAVNDIFSEEERNLTGRNGVSLEDKVKQNLEEEAITTSLQFTPLVRMQDMRTLYPWQGKESDAEIAFNFESILDAQGLYDFVVDTGMLEPGEVKMTAENNQVSVHFMPHVLITKPDVIQAAMLAFYDQVNDDPESDEEFEDLAQDIAMILDERVKISGAPKKGAKKGNPFHDKDTGKFTDPGNMKGDGGGSFSKAKTKLKFSKEKTSKKGDRVVHFAATKLPCGRAARRKGKDVRCWDGKKGMGFQIARVMKKRVRKEHVTDDEVRMVIEAIDFVEANARWCFEE